MNKPDLITEAVTIVDYFHEKARVADIKGFDWDYEGFQNYAVIVEQLIEALEQSDNPQSEELETLDNEFDRLCARDR